jgi:hypothetical protein
MNNEPVEINGTYEPSTGELYDLLMEHAESGFIYPLCAELRYVANYLLKQQAEIDAAIELVKKFQEEREALKKENDHLLMVHNYKGAGFR